MIRVRNQILPTTTTKLTTDVMNRGSLQVVTSHTLIV